MEAYESVSELLSIQNPVNGQTVYVKSYHNGLAIGGGHFIYDSSKAAQKDEVVVFNGWVRQFINQKEYDATWGGAIPNGVSDATDGIQKVLNIMPAYSNLNFPVGTFLINTIKIKQLGIRFIGKDRINTVLKFRVVNDCIKIKEACGFHHLSIIGTGVFNHDVLILDEKDHNRADVDVDINDCYLSESQYAIRIFGRGVIVDNSSFFNIRIAWLDLEFPAQDVFEPGPFNNMNARQGMRGYIFRNNRNHYSPCYMVKNIGWNSENAKGFLITGNQLEGGSRLIFGACREATISGNISYHRTADWKYIEATSLQDIVISGNTFYQYEDSDFPETPDSGEFITINKFAKNITITSNNFKRIGQSLVRIYTDLNTLNSNITIKNNHYEQCFNSSAPLLNMQSGKFDQVEVEEILSAPNDTWIAVTRNAGLSVINHLIKVSAIGSSFIHNLSRAVSLGSTYKQGVYVGTGSSTTKELLIGYEPRLLKIQASDGTVCLLPYGTSSMANGITGVNINGIATLTGNANKENVIYFWEAS